MDFDFSFEQRQIAGSVARMLDSFPVITDHPPHPYPAESLVRAAAETGVFATDGDAFLLGHVDAVAVAIEVGRRLPAAPLVEMLAAGLGLSGSSAPVEAALADGGVLGVAVDGQLALENGAASGRVLVPFAAEAATILAPCATADGRRWITVETGNAELAPAAVLDIATDARWVSVTGAAADPGNAPAPGTFEDALAVLVLAEMTGSAAACLEQTVAYVGDRTQFGRPVGANQAVKHIAADAAVALEGMKAAVEYAAWCLDQGDLDSRGDARRALLTARAFVGDHARRIAEACVQMHGGIAFTWDHGVHRYLKRIAYRRSTIARPRQGRAGLADILLDGIETC
ncbi:acyl-CoA dehydrogenase family protein [Microbaculum marinum]|uniref:Acyl-CoA dehydrogenase family protein n=1 Tax=Microbaculum marinum TaxID=1764581 RepID=A0AAW9RYR0_9HYPH